MSKKIKILSAVLVFWVVLFISWEWWQSFPKVRFNTSLKVNSQKEGIDSILSQAMSSFLLPGISVAIVQDGSVSYLDAFGYENLDTKDSLTVKSQILAASVSKLFTALGVASVFMDRELISADHVYSLDLGEHVKSSSVVNLSFQDLLSHQSGVRDKYFSEMIFSFSKSQNLNEWGVEFLENGAKYQTDSIAYNYADSNYDLLGFLLSRSENLDFDSLLQRNILKPSGMVNSKFLTSWPIEENRITGYQKTFLWKRLVPKRIHFPILPSPSSGLLTTTKDMSLAMVHLLRGEMGVYQKALDWLTIEENGTPLGFQKIQINEREWIGHFGSQAGYSCLLFYSIESKTGIFLFANARDKEDFRIAIASQIITYISP